MRKLQRSGELYFVSLPTPWIKNNNLKKGAELDVQTNDNVITIKPLSSSSKNYKKTSLKIKKAGSEAIKNIIMSLFVAGYDEFKLSFSEELSNEQFLKIKKIITSLGLGIINLNKKEVKIDVNIEISDVKKFVHNLIYQSINFCRMTIEKENTDLLKEQFTYFYNQRYILVRTIYRYQQGLTNLEIKPYEANFYHNIGRHITHLIIHMSYLKDKKYLDNLLKILEKFLTEYDNPNLEKLTELNDYIENLDVSEAEKVTNNENYRIRRVYRSLKDIISDYDELIMINQ
jgi:hypothetical protein